MNKINETPIFSFFRSTPKKLTSQPPLCSSLQSLESCFYLISINRYPHALTTCASSLESAMKSVLIISPQKFIVAKQLYNEAIKIYPALLSFNNIDLDNFRENRNRITHYGFSPKDDEETAVLLLKTGLPFLIECLKEFFDFDLMVGLITEISKHLDVALKVFKKVENTDSQNLKYCFSAFAHLIRWNWLRITSMSEMEISASDINHFDHKKYELSVKIKDELEHTLGTTWSFDCPVCDDCDSFICELDDVLLENRVVSLKRGVCANCDLVISNEIPVLLNTLCEEQILTDKDEILREYGIK